MAMLGRYALVGATHLLCTALVLKILNFILPCCVTCYYTCTANILMCLFVAKLTFKFTKKNFLNDRIQPDNRAVLITGCDSGFGNALAKQLDTNGFHVFASCMFSSGPGVEELRKSCSKRLQILELDVRKDESVKNAAEYVKDNLGTSELWAVVNNAGIFKGCTVELTNIKDFKDTMEVNTFGVVRVTKAFLPLLRQSKGRVVNLASLSGRITTPHMAAYVMSKFATVGFTGCLRQELNVWGVKVISVEPEFFQTNITSSENISKELDATLASIDEDVKADYGDNYLKNFKMYCQFCPGRPSSKVHKVINALELAISLEHPDPVYKPCRNVFARTCYCLYENLPIIMQDLLTKFYFYTTGFPKPKESDNTL